MSYKIKPIGAHSVLYVMAADAEYGPHLQKTISPLFTGVGPVEAAIALTRTLGDLAAKTSLPDFVISLGSAGSRDLTQTHIYQASSVSYRDMDASLLGFEKGTTPFLDLPAELNLSPQLPGVPKATLSTGANIISGTDYDAISAQMVDMETYALKRVCQTFNLPLIALRGISDGSHDLDGLLSWTQYLHIIDEKLAIAVTHLEENIRNNEL
ncbi:MAG: 5'-methylthioadenosine/S-adenosylhomocysteine nucleosidase [Devosiaceae bacterium]|nr:5'-methylthioadenosine/S-adenosylhomocysteine nucleosidase [Devosiaceae bacterium]